MVPFLLLLIFLLWIGLLIYRSIKKPHNFPPGPLWLPILGSALTLVRLKKKAADHLYLAIANLAEQYGPMVSLRVGNDVIVACCSYESIMEMLNNEDFNSRPLTPFCYARTWGTKRGILFTEGELQKKHKNFIIRQLKKFGITQKHWLELVEANSNDTVTEFKQIIAGFEDTGKVIELTNAFGAKFLSIFWTLLSSRQYSTEDEEMKKLKKILYQFFYSIDVTGALFSHFPFLIKVAPKLSGYNYYVGVHQQMALFVKEEVERHRKDFQKGKPRDLIDAYLEEMDSEDRNSDFSELQLQAVIIDLFMTSSETSISTLGFGLLYMLLYPEVQVKAREEIDRVVGRDRLPTFDDRPNLPYIEAIVNESLRMFISRVITVPYRALKTCQLQGYTIPKGTLLVGHFYSVHMEKEYWGDPEVFRPERFLNSEGKIVLPDYFMPFGHGPRRCLAQNLARVYVFVMIAALLQNFEFMVPPGKAPPSTKGVDGFTPTPGTYSALVKYRK